MNSLFIEEGFRDITNRLNALSATSERKWGKMTVGQMLWHCQLPLKLAIENKQPKKRGSLIARIFFKKAMYNDKPWRKNLPTAPKLKARDTKIFDEEIAKLRQLIEATHNLKNRKEWHPHPMFGVFTHEQWGQMQYKHLDHHLRQFGV
ncbi:DUF1569 domain-containing protein [Arenibacter sp. GZD96]|uniref:DUF1569 domain-containing protein n=1 Tax=Aurantibrevibacter litoralis TaxID=3106030 RepID=UPI002B000207|nr:DUF1569 domain-containing protein [Arenibacter sp. GZD-96]MEA1785909.1 DUF1569 domain-containing protein [Arenibacter sp. GZD-96]